MGIALTVSLALITGLVGTLITLAVSNVVTQKQLSEEKELISTEIDDRIEKATKEFATKESVQYLSTGFEKLEKKFDDFGAKLEKIVIDIAVMAERRKESR